MNIQSPKRQSNNQKYFLAVIPTAVILAVYFIVRNVKSTRKDTEDFTDSLKSLEILEEKPTRNKEVFDN